jgi:hypothetical protein
VKSFCWGLVFFCEPMRTWPWSRKPSKPDFTIDPEGAAVSVPETKALDHANLVFISLSGSMQWGGDTYTPKSWCLQESSNSGTIWNLRVMEGSTSNEDGGECTAITDATFCSWDRCLHWQKAIFSHGIYIELLVISEELHKWYEV